MAYPPSSTVSYFNQICFISNLNGWLIVDGVFYVIRCIILLSNKAEKMKQVVYLLFLSKRCSVERSLYRLTDRPELNDDAGQNDEQDHLDYGYASLDGLVSLNRLSVGCGTTPRRQSGDFTGV